MLPERWGYSLVDVNRNLNVHGGSIRLKLQKGRAKRISKSVNEFIEQVKTKI